MNVSLIIPAFNEEHYIGACLDSVLACGPGKFLEIIVVDNASTDRTAAIAQSRAGVRVLHEAQKGPTFARERGYREATGDVIAFIDADTRMSTSWHERLLYEFTADSTLACLSGPYLYYDVPPIRGFLLNYMFWYLAGLPAYFFVGYMAIAGNCAFPKKVLDQMGGLDTSIAFYGDDTDMARRASAFGKVRFRMSFVLKSSARRLKGAGVLHVGYHYMLNFLSVVMRKRPATGAYQDFR